MAKKRKCRLTTEEQDIHAEAVRLRKMTDAQLVAAFKAANTSAESLRATQEGSNAPETTNNTTDVEKLLQALSEGKCKGIAGGTIFKLSEFAKSMGLIA